MSRSKGGKTCVVSIKLRGAPLLKCSASSSRSSGYASVRSIKPPPPTASVVAAGAVIPATAGCGNAASQPHTQERRRGLPKPDTIRMTVSAEGVRLDVSGELRKSMRSAPPAPPPDLAAKYGVCAISGEFARYVDPLSGVRYGSLAAFAQLRRDRAA